jgi:hypothetical protein
VTDSNGKVSSIASTSLEIQRPRPASSPGTYSQTNYVGSLEYVITQATNLNGVPPNVGRFWTVKVDEREICRGYFGSPVKCSFEAVNLANGEHKAKLVFLLDDGQVYLPTSELIFSSQLADRPLQSLGNLNYIENKYSARASVGFTALSGSSPIKKVECTIDSGVPSSGVLETNSAICSINGKGLSKGIHSLKVKLVLENGLEVMKGFSFTSSLTERPLPKLSPITLFSTSDWQAQFSLTLTKVADQPQLIGVYWFIDDAASYFGNSVKNNLYLHKFDSTDLRNGTHRVRVEFHFADGQISKVQKNLKVSLLPPPPPAPTVVWNSNLKKFAWESGSTVAVGGKLVGRGTLPKTVKMRAWQVKSGWSSWITASVSRTGNFQSAFRANSPLSVQVQVPKMARTPATQSQTKVAIYGKVTISAPRKVSPDTQLWFKISTTPKWSGNLDCTLLVERYDDYGSFLGRSYGYPTIKITNGYGTLNPGTTHFRNNQVTLSCGLGWAGMSELSAGVGYATINIY